MHRNFSKHLKDLTSATRRIQDLTKTMTLYGTSEPQVDTNVALNLATMASGYSKV